MLSIAAPLLIGFFKKAPEPEPELPTGMPASFIACMVMWFLHGFVLDIFIIGVVPVISGAKTADAMFYDGKLPNLMAQHRRFIAENSAYAISRLAPLFFTTNMPVLLCAVISYLAEGFTICRELIKYKAPSDAMGPQTLLSLFASLVTYAATMNTDGYIKDQDPTVLLAMQICTGLTWCCWAAGAMGNAANKKAA